MSLHREFLCCHERCHGIICLTPEQEAKYRKTHEAFRCPMGHVQGFYGKNDQEKKIEELEQKLASWRRTAESRLNTICDLRAELRSRSARIGATTRKLNKHRNRSHHKKVTT